MEYITISHKREHEYKIHAVSSEQHESYSVFNVQRDNGHWSSRKSDENMQEYIVLDFQGAVTLDFIEMAASPGGGTTFPRDFRFEGSLDGNSWMVIHTEKKLELDDEPYRLNIPLTLVRYLKLLIITSRQTGGKHYSEIGRIRAGIAGVADITASSAAAADRGAEKLLAGSPESYWESEPKSHAVKETVSIDLGKIFHVNRIILGSAARGFPENIFIETSSDNNVWMPLLEEKNFKAQVNKKYFWNTNITPARYIRIEVKGTRYPEGKYGVQLSQLEISAAPFNPFHTHNIGDLTPYSSIFQAGIVRMAKDGDDSPGTAVQASDRRLRDATTIFKGIVQLAEDGDNSAGIAVQASDSRLKPATDLKYGTVRLAHNRETKAGAVVQGNDSRLQEATSANFGIVKLCPDGMYKDSAAVTGNDRRLHKATEESFGICKLAHDGSTAQGTVVQANDRRLRTATTDYAGIVELAEDGETKAGIAVQGSDRRLKDATTAAKGIVELAEDGEDRPGVAVQGSDKRLKDASTAAKGIVELAEDGEDRPGVAVQGNDRRLKDASTAAKGIVELAEDGENKPGVAVQGNDKRLRDASTTAKGIVELAEDGENKPGVAVQGNDKRLKDASTTAKGIVELAEDGEDKAGVAVQGNDKRLKDATTAAKGIVELAKDGEDRPGVAVQGNDRRLKDASTTAKGIVELAEDGENRPGVAVQGNDKRLRDASTTAKGIVELAEDGENRPGVAVQGNDKRLRDASTTAKGIVELAEDGEDKAGVAVQGNDRRLRDASTTAKGIVELAEDGEDRPGVAVQGNDRRLTRATEQDPGIIALAKSGESRPGFAVQSTDARLADARAPLPHAHDYAERVHDFSGHAGTLAISGTRHETVSEITPPSDGSAIIHAKNESPEAGSIGIAGIAGVSSEKAPGSYGVMGHGGHVGVRGQSSGGTEARGCGVLGLSRFGAGGVFASEHDFSLVADGFGEITRYDGSVSLSGNGDALYVRGKSEFHGMMRVLNARENDLRGFPANIVEIFEVDDAEYVSPGDLLVASEGGKTVLSRSRQEYHPGVIGVVSGNPTFIIDNSGNKSKVYPVALAGTVFCRIDARKRPVRPGDLIVTAETPGCGMAGSIDSFAKIGTVLGKALDALDDGISIIPVFLSPG